MVEPGHKGIVPDNKERDFINDKLHRDGDQPAFIRRDATTGIVTEERYLKDGKEHRDGDQPSFIVRNATTGTVVYESYYKDGVKTPVPAKRPVHGAGQAANPKPSP